ncbi:MAG: pseudouridine synthase [Parachlamydiales bacterium]
MTKERLSKFLASSGIASRRACEELIFDGQVSVNGEVCLVPQTKVDAEDKILVRGKDVKSKPEFVYFLLNKPKGYVCSHAKASHKHIVMDLFKDHSGRLVTAGRLDKDTEGLLIVTNDGEYANKVIHPSSNLTKEYLVKVSEEVTPEHLYAISSGTLVEGVFVKPKKVSKVRRGTLRISVSEGKKHEVRRLAAAAGLNVISLTRIRLGGLLLGNIPVGSWKALGEKERMAVFQ